MSTNLEQFHIIGNSRPMRELADWLYTAAPHWDPVLITGERGTGKELLAHAIHALGPTRGKPMTIVDCASLHPATLESTLFGHERGAFTGALHRHIGYLELAHESSVFFDEITSLTPEAQGRLLRFLEEKTITRVGGTHPIAIRTRILAASNRDMIREIKEGRLLPDLYDRLNVFPVQLPPLRQRDGDVLLLAEHFLGKAQLEAISADIKAELASYDYPGNIRELKNLCRRLCVFVAPS